VAVWSGPPFLSTRPQASYWSESGNAGTEFSNDVRAGVDLFTNWLVARNARTGQPKLVGISSSRLTIATGIPRGVRYSDGSKLEAVARKDDVVRVVGSPRAS
jgi:hypothetical protein